MWTIAVFRWLYLAIVLVLSLGIGALFFVASLGPAKIPTLWLAAESLLYGLSGLVFTFVPLQRLNSALASICFAVSCAPLYYYGILILYDPVNWHGPAMSLGFLQVLAPGGFALATMGLSGSVLAIHMIWLHGRKFLVVREVTL